MMPRTRAAGLVAEQPVTPRTNAEQPVTPRTRERRAAGGMVTVAHGHPISDEQVELEVERGEHVGALVRLGHTV